MTDPAYRIRDLEAEVSRLTALLRIEREHHARTSAQFEELYEVAQRNLADFKTATAPKPMLPTCDCGLHGQCMQDACRYPDYLKKWMAADV